jgi:SAM-dependent methyltransferase
VELLDIIGRASPPEPWDEGDNIPWHEPGFSARMLHEHLSQEHDAASRRSGTIDRHIAWIHQALLGERPARILDLGCGPGFYSSRLARLGHQCVGIDYSPASIAYARAEAEAEGLACHYELSDIREAELGAEFNLAMLIFGELNIFRPGHAAALLARVRNALAPGGMLLLEAHTYGAVQRIGEGAPTWAAATAGLFSDRPHVRLTEHFWRPEAGTATTRFYVIDAASGEVSRYAQSFQAYTDEEYAALGRECGFSKVSFLPSLTGDPAAEASDLLVMVVEL